MKKYTKYEKGMKFGKITLVERCYGGQKWKCKCDCGKEVITQISHGSRECRKCAYERIGKERTLHGESSFSTTKTKLYTTWINIRARCAGTNRRDYKHYGGRGITVFKEWDDYICFKKWANENGYSEGLEIDRIDNDGNYEPNNCRWVDRKTQMRNTRKNHFITLGDKTMVVMDWCKELNVQKSWLYCGAKKKGISVEDHLKYIIDLRSGKIKRTRNKTRSKANEEAI